MSSKIARTSTELSTGGTGSAPGVASNATKHNGIIIDLNVGGCPYKTLKSTLLGDNLRFYAHKLAELNQDSVKHHRNYQTAEPGISQLPPITTTTTISSLQDLPVVPVPTILPTVFADIFNEIQGNHVNYNNHNNHNHLHIGIGMNINNTNNNALYKLKDMPVSYKVIHSNNNAMFINNDKPPKGHLQNDEDDKSGGSGFSLFIDRDGPLFRHILDYMRTGEINLPCNFTEYPSLLTEAKFYRLPHMEMTLAKMADEFMAQMAPPLGLLGLGGVSSPGRAGIGQNFSYSSLATATNEPVNNNENDLKSLSSMDQLAIATASETGAAVGTDQEDRKNSFLNTTTGGLSFSRQYRERGYITLGYRGTFAFGRDGQADVKFRKLSRILVSGRVSLCRQVFGDTLNESRDPDRGHYERYSSRFFLKHNFLEQAFDDLQKSGFRCVCAAASGTSGSCKDTSSKSSSHDNEENRWNHYNEFVFCRP